MERGLGVHSQGGASVSWASFSLLYPHLNCISEKNSANWLRWGGGSGNSEGDME